MNKATNLEIVDTDTNIELVSIYTDGTITIHPSCNEEKLRKATAWWNNTTDDSISTQAIISLILEVIRLREDLG